MCQFSFYISGLDARDYGALHALMRTQRQSSLLCTCARGLFHSTVLTVHMCSLFCIDCAPPTVRLAIGAFDTTAACPDVRLVECVEIGRYNLPCWRPCPCL